MICIKISGGLGNQMFQYAFGRAISNKLKTDLCLDLSWFQENTKSTIREFQLDLFNTEYIIADSKTIKSFKPLLYRVLNTTMIKLNFDTLQLPKYFIEDSLPFNSNVHIINDNCYLNGYWQSEKYFLDIKKDLLLEFELNCSYLKDLNNSLLNKIKTTESVSIHIRRSDYTNTQNINIHGILPISYYHESMKIINSKYKDPNYFIFSDDIEWAISVFDCKSENFHFVPKNPNYIDLYLNSKCKHNIIANSTFSWWSAWLNNNSDKTVIAPLNWYSNKNLNDLTFDLLPELWIRI